MNIVKRLLMNNGAHSKDKLILIPSGQLYLVRSPSSPKSENECLYSDVILSIRDISSSYNYQLVIRKSNHLSDQDILSDDEIEDGNGEDDIFENESSVLKTFLIDFSLKVCLFEKYDQKIICWKDMDGDIGDTYEYRINPTVAIDTIEQFMLAIYKCQYERKYKKSSSGVDLSVLQEFVVDKEELYVNGSSLSSIPSSSSTLRISKQLRAPNRLEDEVEFANEEDEEDYGEYDDDSPEEEEEVRADELEEGEEEESDDDQFEDAKEVLNSRVTHDKVLSKTEIDLFIYDPKVSSFKLYSNDAEVCICDLGGWDYWMECYIHGKKKMPVKSYVIQQLDPTFNFEQLSFIFNIYTENDAYTWLYRFKDRLGYETFQKYFMKALWEHKQKSKYIEKNVDEEYLIDALNNVALSDTDIEDVEDDEIKEETDEFKESSVNLKKRKKLTSYEDNDDDEDYNTKQDDFAKGEMNSGLKIGLRNDRAFISRGNKIGIFKTDHNGVEFSCAIENLSSFKNSKQNVSPNRMMLQDGDRTMVIQDSKDLSKLYKVDLEYGSIVEDWELKKDAKNLAVESFTSNGKFSELTSDQTFIGASSQSLFRVDPRIKDSLIVDSEYKNYKTKTDFTQVVTTDEGYIAAATKKGEIKLYDKLGKKAKTILPALGDEIIGLTTSTDGRFILATCSTYLLLIDVKIKKGKFNNKLGFERSFGIDDKPLPKKLNLRPEHLIYIKQQCGNNVKFSKANFNVGYDSKQKRNPTLIVTSIGPFAITWNLRKVLKNQDEPYKIRRYLDDILIGDFTVKDTNTMVLTMPNDVTMVSNRTFRSPKEELNIVKTAF